MDLKIDNIESLFHAQIHLLVQLSAVQRAQSLLMIEGFSKDDNDYGVLTDLLNQKIAEQTELVIADIMVRYGSDDLLSKLGYDKRK